MGPILRLALFRLPDFRRLAASILGNSVGMMGETVVLGWLTLELTNSPFLVGVAVVGGSLGVGAIVARCGSGAAYRVVATGCLAGARPRLVASRGERPAPRPSGSLWHGVVDLAAAARNDGTLFVLMLISAPAV